MKENNDFENNNPIKNNDPIVNSEDVKKERIAIVKGWISIAYTIIIMLIVYVGIGMAINYVTPIFNTIKDKITNFNVKQLVRNSIESKNEKENVRYNEKEKIDDEIANNGASDVFKVDNYFKIMYLLAENIKFENGIEVPTLFKYAKLVDVEDYEYVENEEFFEESYGLKYYYKNIPKDDLRTYKNSIVEIENFVKETEKNKKEIYIRQNTELNRTAYIIIDGDCITYGSAVTDPDKE